LSLTVTSGSQQKSAQKFISVSGSAEECFAQQ
jgi:hypothetical protein